MPEGHKCRLDYGKEMIETLAARKGSWAPDLVIFGHGFAPPTRDLDGPTLNISQPKRKAVTSWTLLQPYSIYLAWKGVLCSLII